MEAAPNDFDNLLSKAGEYAATRATLIKLKIADKTSDTVSDAASSMVVGIFLVIFLLCFSVGLALWIGELLGKTYYGFFIVALVYGIAGIIFHVNRKSLVKTPVSNFIITKILKARE
ncbi:MAG TPA: phage holin family protein [Chitinophagaceae bacterium]|nr:phage holin family protein [Chitinophagaceae bacterium]